MPELSESELVRQSLLGNIEAFGTLVQRHQRSVFNVCYRMLGERGLAEDLTQDTFIRAHQRLETFDIKRPFGPWIRRIATNLCLNHLKRKQPILQPLEDELTISTPGGTTNPERVQIQREQRQTIRQALAELPPHYRAVIELRHFQDMNYQEISETLNLPINTAKSHLFRARKLLAEKLENSYEYA